VESNAGHISSAMAFLAASALAGCAEYMDRKDTVAFSAGEAASTNVLAHVIDPWPAHAARRNLPYSGERGARAVRHYQSPPQAATGPSTVINVR
jgi:hypothetical protein